MPKQFNKLAMNLMQLSVLLFMSIATIGCQQLHLKVNVSDQEWCGDKGALGAKCFHTLTSAERTVSKADWDAERFGMVCAKSNVFADVQTDITKLCGTNRCTFQERQMVEDFFAKLNNFRSEARSLQK